MKWTVGALALLVGVGGCSFFHSTPDSSAQSFAYGGYPPAALGTARAAGSTTPLSWTGESSGGSVARYATYPPPSAPDYTCARPSLAPTPIPESLTASTAAARSMSAPPPMAPDLEPPPPSPPPIKTRGVADDDIVAPLPTPQPVVKAPTPEPTPPAPSPPAPEPVASSAPPAPVVRTSASPADAAGPPAMPRVTALLSSRALPPLSKQNAESGVAPVAHTEPQPKKTENAMLPPAGPRVPDTRLATPHPRPKVRVVDTAVRMVKSRRFTLNFAFRDVGPSGVSAVELWYTQDGQEWRMHEVLPKKPPYVVEVDEEGRYGFTLLARSGVGLGPKPPAAGDEPQMWVVVDQTKPEVQLLEVSPTKSGNKPAMVIQWKATDPNLSRQPISLMFADREAGPWQPIAVNLLNNGRYTWELPENMPGQFLVRIEAVDLAGNVGHAQTTTPVVLDNSTPTVSILNIEAGGR